MVMVNRTFAALCLGVSLAGVAAAQRGPARATVTPIVDRDAVPAGGDVRVALQVNLPAGYHVNSNKPRDPVLIPTTLRITPPEGITVDELVFPEPVDLQQRGADQPLRVFERDFAIGVALRVAATVPAGEVTIPAAFRYQACDEVMCYIPSTKIGRAHV